MASDMFIKIGDIKGESQDDAHKDEIDVLGWAWGMSNPGSAVKPGSSSAPPSFQDFSFVHHVDLASPSLMLACCDGKHYPEARLTVRSSGEKPLEYLKITMNDLIITSVSSGGSGGEERPSETVTLNFAKVKVEYQQQDRDGSPGAKNDMGWDLRANKEA